MLPRHIKHARRGPVRGFALLLLFLSPPPEGATGEGVAFVSGESVVLFCCVSGESVLFCFVSGESAVLFCFVSGASVVLFCFVSGESVGIVLEVVERSTSTEQGLVVQLVTTVGGRSSFKELEPRAACSNTSGHVPHKQWMAEVHRL